MKVLNFTIIKLTICLVAGILIGYYFSFSLSHILYTISILFVLLLITFVIARKQFLKTVWFGLFAYLLMICLGTLTVYTHNEIHFKNHYSNYIANENDSLNTTTFKIREVLKPTTYHNKYIVDILKIGSKNVTGKALLNVQKDSTSQPFKVNAVLLTKTSFELVNPPLNPGQFNYKKYLEKKYIYHQLFVQNKSLYTIKSEKHTLLGFADAIRTHINSKLQKQPFNPEELAIINALLLGQRQDISEETYTHYTNAGAIHILAVSGLHIGIILLLLNFVLKPLERLKKGNLIKTIVLLLILWCFAIIAGLSASVTRAVTMFSVIAFAQNLKRPTNIFNTLAISIFVLLLAKPLLLFDVGFQLSYMAVLAIVTIDPILYKLWQPKNKIIKIYWHTLTITVAAQLGVMPLSLYYFHNIPGLFFLSNLVIIPFLGLVLGFGIIVILLALLNCLPTIIAKAYGFIISSINSFVEWVSLQEQFLLKDIYFGLLYVFVFYILLISLINFLKQKHYKSLKLLLISILAVQSAFLYTNFKNQGNQFIVFHKSRYTLIGNIENNRITTSSDLDSLSLSQEKTIKNFNIKNHIKTHKTQKLAPFYLFNNKKVLVIDSLGIYNIKSLKPDYVLLRQSPQINLNRLIDSLNPKYIIADGSNYTSYVENWEAICLKRKLPFHHTGKKGAFIIDY
ncbi:ComEC family competence protein [Flavobacteriaceae bacterium XHP0103]|uniref:ComEC/Rec2 family competence protein n=1 Tax=Marixanthotalea marina TaxID=2844359 RepID=UPI002989A08C|nr:ComEC/Rec2 family competence protein [Marixanthotalea marina]MBU3821053.1 ComEC family competence protein [Marixanthotalea marina]